MTRCMSPSMALYSPSQSRACPALAITMAAERELRRLPSGPRRPSTPSLPATLSGGLPQPPSSHHAIAVPPASDQRPGGGEDRHKRKKRREIAGEINLTWTSARRNASSVSRRRPSRPTSPASSRPGHVVQQCMLRHRGRRLWHERRCLARRTRRASDAASHETLQDRKSVV